MFHEQRLLIVTGKGGVGKTATSTALGLGFARRGLRTLVCEVNTKERVSSLLGRPEAGPTIGSLDENLWSVNVRPHEALREYALMTLRFETIYNAVFENRLVRYFLRFVPSVQELVMLGKILFHLKEKRPDGSWRFDRIIVDAPATGHAITFFSVPQVVLDTVPPGALADDARWMRDALTDPATTGAVLVSMPEELPVNETLELRQALATKVRLPIAAVVLNAYVASRFTEAQLKEPALMQAPLVDELCRVHELRAQASAEAVRRLSAIEAPLIVPRLYLPEFDRSAIETMARHLSGGATHA